MYPLKFRRPPNEQGLKPLPPFQNSKDGESLALQLNWHTCNTIERRHVRHEHTKTKLARIATFVAGTSNITRLKGKANQTILTEYLRIGGHTTLNNVGGTSAVKTLAMHTSIL